jgi:hypothetical protein
MRVGVTGHQRRQGADWRWVDDQLATELRAVGRSLCGYSSLAEGADQRFAKAVIEAGGELNAVIPMQSYERHFDNPVALAGYRWLLERSRKIELASQAPPEKAFLEAGEWIVAHVDRLIAVWDEMPAAGLGGTADIVDFAQRRGVSVLVINPVTRTVGKVNSCR